MQCLVYSLQSILTSIGLLIGRKPIMATIEERHSELFQPISTESPRGKARTVPMQALCLGFNRTGTSS